LYRESWPKFAQVSGKKYYQRPTFSSLAVPLQYVNA
jgi:hypothetical protein